MTSPVLSCFCFSVLLAAAYHRHVQKHRWCFALSCTVDLSILRSLLNYASQKDKGKKNKKKTTTHAVCKLFSMSLVSFYYSLISTDGVLSRCKTSFQQRPVQKFRIRTHWSYYSLLYPEYLLALFDEVLWRQLHVFTGLGWGIEFKKMGSLY